MKARLSLRQLKRTLARPGEAPALPETTDLWVDSTVQRFEFSFELYWKTMRQILEAEGLECATPRETLRQAFRSRLIENESAWLDLLKARNATSRAYDEELARRVIDTVRRRFPAMLQHLPVLESRLSELEAGGAFA